MKNYRFTEHKIGYKVGKTLQPFRPQNKMIISMVKNRSKVLDVGCGDGNLGKMLIDAKDCHVSGLDLDKIAVLEAKRKGIDARLANFDDKLPFKNQSFDYVVMSDCLQYSSNPDFVVSELLRVGKIAIIEFPNFGFWFYRLQLLFGRLPKLSLYGHKWWNTLQTRFFSLNDFLDLPSMKKTTIKRLVCIDWKNRSVSLLAKFFPNFFGRSCILEIK